ncbi:hypothetical protein ACNKHO_20575 [Shigella flexneri]
MTTVDINTGAFVGHRNLDDTIFNTRSKRRRPSRASFASPSGGIIIIDFYRYE